MSCMRSLMPSMKASPTSGGVVDGVANNGSALFGTSDGSQVAEV